MRWRPSNRTTAPTHGCILGVTNPWRAIGAEGSRHRSRAAQPNALQGTPGPHEHGINLPSDRHSLSRHRPQPHLRRLRRRYRQQHHNHTNATTQSYQRLSHQRLRHRKPYQRKQFHPAVLCNSQRHGKPVLHPHTALRLWPHLRRHRHPRPDLCWRRTQLLPLNRRSPHLRCGLHRRCHPNTHHHRRP